MPLRITLGQQRNGGAEKLSPTPPPPTGPQPQISAIPTLAIILWLWPLQLSPFLSFLWLFSWMLVQGLSHWGGNSNKRLFVPVSVSSCHQESTARNPISSSHVAQLAFCFIRLTETTSLRFPNWFTCYRFFFSLLKGFWIGLAHTQKMLWNKPATKETLCFKPSHGVLRHVLSGLLTQFSLGLEGAATLTLPEAAPKCCVHWTKGKLEMVCS